MTINGDRLTAGWANSLANLCGAVAVSYYNHETTLNAIKLLTDQGLSQVNIHAMIAHETFASTCNLLKAKSDPRLENLNAIIFLSLKQRGRGIHHTPLSQNEFAILINMAIDLGVPFGMDSCSAHKFLQVTGDKYLQSVEPCEAGLFSAYINVEGRFFPCSFTEEGAGLDVVNCHNFLEDVWYHPQTIAWRRQLISAGRHCPVYNI